MRRLVVCLWATACVPAESDGTTAETSGSSTAGSGASTSASNTTDASPETSGSGAPTTAASDTGLADDTSTGEPASSSSGGGGPRVPGDCHTLLLEDPSTPDGVYSLHRGGDPQAPTFDAYCDMSTAGGGWTLVGRSVPGDWGDLPFGWTEATGDLANQEEPYSLDAAGQQLQFTEVLVGSRTAGVTWDGNAYALTVPPNFVYVYGKAPFATTITTVVGDCEPTDGPSHLRYIGWTESPGIFHIANIEGYDGDGLERNGWDTDVAGCDGGGELNALQGMIMVR
ncbi:MAG: fibrinogen-like YCDxxxxGGGW domain-containing protein [Nannocystaceae bacterium]